MNNLQKENLGSLIGSLVALGIASIIGFIFGNLKSSLHLFFPIVFLAYICSTQTQMRTKVKKKKQREVIK